jgi:hypothetical protein
MTRRGACDRSSGPLPSAGAELVRGQVDLKPPRRRCAYRLREGGSGVVKRTAEWDISACRSTVTKSTFSNMPERLSAPGTARWASGREARSPFTRAVRDRTGPAARAAPPVDPQSLFARRASDRPAGSAAGHGGPP